MQQIKICCINKIKKDRKKNSENIHITQHKCMHNIYIRTFLSSVLKQDKQKSVDPHIPHSMSQLWCFFVQQIFFKTQNLLCSTYRNYVELFVLSLFFNNSCRDHIPVIAEVDGLETSWHDVRKTSFRNSAKVLFILLHF